MEGNGYIKLHRQIMNNEFYFAEKFSKSGAWIDLLLLANHKPATIFIRGIEIKLNSGDLCYSQLTLAKRWSWSDKTVKKYLDLLKSRRMIDFKGGRITTVISILNWSKYQISTEQIQAIKSISNSTFSDYDSEQLPEQTPNNLRTDKNVKNDKEVRKISFADKVVAFSYPKSMLEDFIGYWTESNENENKMRFEMEKVFDIKRRLKNWADNQNKFFTKGKETELVYNPPK
jgi:hypothetical protein